MLTIERITNTGDFDENVEFFIKEDEKVVGRTTQRNALASLENVKERIKLENETLKSLEADKTSLVALNKLINTEVEKLKKEKAEADKANAVREKKLKDTQIDK